MHVSSDRSQSRIPPAGEKLDDENINTGSSRNKAASINPKVHTLTNPAGKTAMPHPPTPELPQNAHQLLNQFFSSTQPWMPIFQRHSVYRTLSEYRQHCLNSEAPTDLRTGENSLLWAIFAHSTTSPLFFDDTKKVMTQPPSQSAGEIYRIARGMIPAEDENKYTTGHVQAFLVLALTQYCSHQWSIASLITGQAILAARHIGLDKSVLKTEERKYTWLGCFAIDTLVSLHTGQTPHLRPSQIRTFFPLDTAKNEEWEPWHLQQALLPGVGAEVAEFPEPTHAISMFSQQLEILCLANDWIRANADGRALGNIKDSFLCWNLRLPDDVTYFSTTVDDLSATPSNIIHLQVLQAFLTLPILAVTRQLKADILGYVTLSKEGSDEFPFLGALDKNPNTALASCQLDSSIQQDFDWLDGVPHPWSWSQPTASSLRLYPNELFDNLSTTGMPSTFTHTAGPSEYGHLEYSSGAEEAEE
ncbi:hypothetical protein N7452_001578 [Penicillium brevicompactum]|uniref:Xylanolytic transcriptional activator regulatory domain-containing protein n=1 Tax=Penicillium brevicompactum TaxID=5074 RepID=A0A9W9R4V1_PENBR|nr:hypothetical protein N7452_001578 [Penicillium brevicompactum]